jgi:lysophospholipase L1-like esterase
VVFVGDSITVSALPDLTSAAVGHRYSAYVAAFPGLRSAQIDTLLRNGLSTYPNAYAAVVNAGTNDVYFDVGGSWKHNFESLLARATTPCVVLTTVSEQLDKVVHAPSARTVNTFIRKVAKAHPNYRVVDWNAAVASGAPVVLADGIHPNDAGREWIARHDIAAVQSCGR